MRSYDNIFPGISERQAREYEAADTAQREDMVRTLRLVAGISRLSLREVAARMGTQQSAVSELSRPGIDMRVGTMQAYARAVGRGCGRSEYSLSISLVPEVSDGLDWTQAAYTERSLNYTPRQPIPQPSVVESQATLHRLAAVYAWANHLQNPEFVPAVR